MNTYRIFISYRGGTPGQAFAKKLFDFLQEDFDSESKYGKPYYSPETEIAENFDGIIEPIMKTAEYFVLPLSAGFFDGFWDEEHDCPNPESITRKEIVYALQNKQMKFICVDFPGFAFDEALMHRLFGEEAIRITRMKVLHHADQPEIELVRRISDVLIRADYHVDGMVSFMESVKPNIFLTTKAETENPKLFPFYNRCFGAKRISLMNFAGTSFISGIEISTIYQSSEQMRRWFTRSLAEGEIEANIVLTRPHSIAAQDAALYKMNPTGINAVPIDRIILHNLNMLYQFHLRNPKARLNVYLTGICLPYGLMVTEFDSPENNHIKVDLYSAAITDQERPSFYLMESNPEHKPLYRFFRTNLTTIMANHSFRFRWHPTVDWLNNDTHIIHRAQLNAGLKPHTRSAYKACLGRKCIMEVDLLRLADGTIIAGRDDQPIAEYGLDRPLSSYTAKELRAIRRQDPENEILKLEDLLELVKGKVPLLLEIKTTGHVPDDPETSLYVEQIMAILMRYADQCAWLCADQLAAPSHPFAVHSADPYVLKQVREIDCTVPCGIITSDFTQMEDKVGTEFAQMHRTLSFTRIFDPDFVSCDIRLLPSTDIQNFCTRRNLPLVGWTVRSEDEEEDALDYCDAVIIEGAASFKQ